MIKFILIVMLFGYVKNNHVEEDSDIYPSPFEDATKSRYFIDKTMLLKTVIKHRASLITTPQGFGKSTNLDMIKRFFMVHYNRSFGFRRNYRTTETFTLFSNKSLNLEIMQDVEFVREHMGRYHVLYLDFQQACGTNPTKILESVNERIKVLLRSYHWINDTMTPFAKKDPEGREWLWYYTKAMRKQRYSHWEAMKALIFLSKLLRKYFNVDCLVLIDNFDIPTSFAIAHGFESKDIDSFMQDLLRKCTAELSLLKHVVIVAQNRLYKNILTPAQLYDIDFYYFLGDHVFTPYFGFSENEIANFFPKTAQGKYELQLVKDYYDGYIDKRSSKSILFPPGVLQFLTNKSLNVNYDISDLVYTIFRCFNQEQFMKKMFLLLLKNYLTGSTKYPFHLDRKDLLTFHDLTRSNCANYRIVEMFLLVGTFLDCGYLVRTEEQGVYQMPNLLIKEIIKSELEFYYTEAFNITIVEHTIQSSVKAIINNPNITDQMLTTLADSLSKLLEVNSTTFQKQSILFGAFYFNSHSYEKMKLRKLDDNTFCDIVSMERLPLISDDKRSLLIVAITYKKSHNDTLQEITEYVPVKRRNQSYIHFVKYLSVNLNNENRVEITKGEDRNYW